MHTRWGWLFVAVAMTAACGGGTDEAADNALDTAPAGAPDQTDARVPSFDAPAPAGAMDVQINDAGGRTVGVARITEVADGVQLEVRVAGLAPGEHGIHIHAAGLCEAPAFESAGPHFTAGAKQHGLDNPQGPHEGDLPNLTVGADGTGTGMFTARGSQLHGTAENGLMREGGTALVIHAGRDDQRTDPSGNSGAHIACGVISMS